MIQTPALSPRLLLAKSNYFRLAAAAALAAASVLAGCNAVGSGEVGIDYKRPKPVAPPSFQEGHSGPTTQPNTDIDLTQWWKTFHDPELDSLIQRSMVGNLTLLTAEARVRQARAELGVQIGGLFPTVDVTGEATKSRTSANTSSTVLPTVTTSSGTGSGSGTGTSGGTTGTTGGTTGTTGGTTGSGSTGTSTGTSTNNSVTSFRTREPELYEAGFDATWELDIFGGQRRAIESAADDVEQYVEARRNALVTLTAEVARDYVLLRGYQQNLTLAYSNLKSEQDTLDLTRSRFNAGLTSDLDVAQAQASVAQTAATVPGYEIQIKQEIHAISLLLGLEPMALAAELGKDGPIPPVPSEIPVGLPSELIRRRPDVRQAERALARDTASIGVSVAELFPRIALTGTVGQQTGRFGLIARGQSTYWSVGPTFDWKIFAAGSLISQVRVSNAIQAQSLYAYKQAVLQSFTDVEDALVAYAQDQNRSKALQDEVSANQRAVDLSNQLYTRGLGDFLNVLTAERNLFSAQTDLANSQSNVSGDLVQLYKALGGGWDENDEGKFQGNENPALKVAVE